MELVWDWHSQYSMPRYVAWAFFWSTELWKSSARPYMYTSSSKCLFLHYGKGGCFWTRLQLELGKSRRTSWWWVWLARLLICLGKLQRWWLYCGCQTWGITICRPHGFHSFHYWRWTSSDFGEHNHIICAVHDFMITFAAEKTRGLQNVW